MKHITQVIAASGLGLPLLLLSWSAESIARMHRRTSQQATVRAEKTEHDARRTFDSRCATCHGKDGRAKTLKAKFNKARDLTDAAWQTEASDERIYNSISHGRGKKMPAFAKKLSRAEVEELVVYVRGLKKKK